MIDTANVPDPVSMDTDALLGFLKDVATELAETLDRADVLYELRTRLYVAARHRSPRVTLRELAEVSGASEAAVTQVLHKVRKAG